MYSLLIKNSSYLVTMNDDKEVLENVDIFIEDGLIKDIGSNLEDKDYSIDKTIDARGKIVYPGLVNTHHHFYQVLTRNYPRVQNMELFDWLKSLYRLWRGLTPDMVYTSSVVAMGELIKYGCTTIHDHHYVFPKGYNNLLERQIEAAKDLGVRIHASRGSMSRGESDGGLPPDSLVESSDKILKDSEDLIRKYHDKSINSMCQIVLAPCSPFSVTDDLLKDSALLAREYGVRLHTHLAETIDEEKYTLSKYKMRPLEYMASLDWIGEDVWYAHGVHFNDEELKILAKTKTGIAHCPVSNQKLSSGIARISEMIKLGIPVGLAVDGSASNDCSNLLAEIRSGYLLQRLDKSNDALTGYDMLSIATRGGAEIFGRKDIGSLEVGKAGDLFLVDSTGLEFAGALDDVASLPATCGINKPVDMTIVGGKIIYQDGVLLGVKEKDISMKANDMAKKLRTFA